MQTTRIQLNSRDSSIDVYKSLPSAELNKRYAIRVEQLTIPAMSDGLILNTELFSVEWRCTPGVHHSVDGVPEIVTELPVPYVFIPQNVKTVSQLVYQMNSFFRKLLVKLVTTEEFFGDPETDSEDSESEADPHFMTPLDFDKQPNSDWYTVQETVIGKRIRSSIEAIYRSDGRIGFKFTPHGQILFVLRLSDEGQRIFGWKHRYIAVDADNRFTKYVHVETVEDFLGNLSDQGTVTSTPLNVGGAAQTESVVCVTENSVFNHGHYRHEIAVLSTLPLQQYVECDQDSAQFKRQLASYRFPNEAIKTEYRGTLYKVLKESRKNIYIFEHANKTHNEFLLTGTDLQNFHIRLMARNYTWSTEKNLFVIDEKPYPLPSDSLWTISLKVTPLE